MSVSIIVWRVDNAPPRLGELFPGAFLNHYIVEYSRGATSRPESKPHPYKPEWRVDLVEKVSFP